jgi:hypothetical protein
MVVMVLRELVARAAAKVEPAHEPKTGEKVERPVYRDHPDLRTAGPNLVETLMLTRRDSSQYSQPLRRGLVPAPTHLRNSSLEPHPRPHVLVEILFHLQGNSADLACQSGLVGEIAGWLSRSAKSL